MHPPSTLSPASPAPRRRGLLVLAAVVIIAPLLVWLVPRDAQAQAYCSPDTHQPSSAPPTILVLTTPTRLPQLCGRIGIEIQNNGPNPIWCAASYVAAHAAVGTARVIAAKGGAWSLSAKDTQPIYCVAETAAQVAFSSSTPTTTGGTTISEVR